MIVVKTLGLLGTDRAGRDPRLLPAVRMAEKGRSNMVTSARSGKPGAIRVAAGPSFDRVGTHLCRVRRCHCGGRFDLALDRGRSCADGVECLRVAVVLIGAAIIVRGGWQG